MASSSILTVDFWDVGQGDCTVLTKPDGELIVIDVGPKNSPLISWLRDHPKKRISDVLLTHNDSDHIGAMPSLINDRSHSLDNIWLLQDGTRTGQRQESVRRLLAPLRRASEEGAVNVYRLEANSVIWKDEEMGIVIRVLYPSLLEEVMEHETPNLGSAIIALEHVSGQVILWPGDNTVKRTAENKPRDLAVHSLMGPHHGGPEDRRRFGQAELIKSIKEITPKNVQISVGKNSYSHPNPHYFTYLRKEGCAISCTGLTRLCDRRIKERKVGNHVMNGSALLGLRRTTTGFACRGAKRLYIDKFEIRPDEFEQQHRKAVKKLTHPYCLPRANWAKDWRPDRLSLS